MNPTYVFTRDGRCILEQLALGSKLKCACQNCRAYVKLSVVWTFVPQTGKNGILIWGEPMGLAPTGRYPFLDPAWEEPFLRSWTAEVPRSLESQYEESQLELEPAKGTRAGDGRLTE